jgi:integrase
MAIFKRGRIYWYHFLFNGCHIQESTKQGNPRVARQMEAAHRTALAKGEVGIRERKRLTLAAFLKDEFLPFVKSKFASKPGTLRYYSYGVSTLLKSDFASLDVSEINDKHAAQYGASRAGVSASCINCGLRTLRRALALAYQWGKLDKPAKITLAKGERQRERVLSDAEVEAYLAACPQPWKDAATIMLGTGARPGEVFALRWEHVALNGQGGLLQIVAGKSRAARRMLPLVPAVYGALKSRFLEHGKPESGWVFPADTPSGHLEGYCAKNQHAAALKAARLEDKPLRPFCPYTLRHTALTRLAEAGCDAFTLARIAGHSSITITQRYCHPQADAIERAFAKLESAPQLAAAK